MKKNIELSLEEARNLYHLGNNQINILLLANFSKEELENKLPTKWEDIKSLMGWYINGDSEIKTANTSFIINSNKNIFASEKEAKSSLAMAQLSQLMKVYRNGWEPDWGSVEYKSCILRLRNEAKTINIHRAYKYLSFPTEELADQFLENFRDLIEDYFMIDKN